METLEDMYAHMMADAPERVQCAKVDSGGADDTLEALYAQRMAQEEAVRAANPYGCNQYGEGWASPHNGMSRVPRGSVPKGDEPKGDEPKGGETGTKKEKKPLEKTALPKKRYFEPAATVKEAKRNTASLVGGDMKKVTWGKNVTVEQINEYNEVMAEMIDKYELRNPLKKLGSFTSQRKGLGAHCRYWINFEGTGVDIELQVNQDHYLGGIHRFDKWKPYNAEIANKLKYTRHNVGVTEDGISIRAIMIHEYGHAIHSMATMAFKRGSRFKLNQEEIRANQKAWEDWNIAFGRALREKDIYKVSEYASTNAKEFFAECFTARELGEKLPDYINSGLDNIIKLATKKS